MVRPVKRITLLVLDSVGCGDAPDAGVYGDEAANTLGNISRVVGGLHLPNLEKLGLGHTTEIVGVPPMNKAAGVYGRLTETSAGKDTTTGHWELAGVVLERPFPTYPHGFPAVLMDSFESRIGRQTLGNYPASGTEILKELGEEHVRTGYPIIYTSADSVFQIAAHEEIIPIDELYRFCEIARELLTGEHAVGRVIARPFTGRLGNFTRTERRKDYSLEPHADTILDVVKAACLEVMGVGKIEDIFAHRGLTQSNHTGNNMAGVDAILGFLRGDTSGLIFANLVDFDALYGHRLDPQGYAAALEAFDHRLPEITNQMRPDDVLFITADHGNDPTSTSTDHSRERVPFLAYGQCIKRGHDLGTRAAFADVAGTIADLLDIPWHGSGESFASEILA
ncbi:MAG TPA: phosphopentomutase [Chloroflexota bacterium]|nr:phosphopentomutase [Chloroflexota bacterium]HUM67662.1 phosphopentomutase [Chloroflexota bacterium]